MPADLDRLWPPFAKNVRALLADADARQLGVYAVSGFRSVELQAALYADALRRYGSAQEARKWVAPPGRSKHGPRVGITGHEPGPYGLAVDLGVVGFRAVAGKWPKHINDQVVALADRYEMYSPLEWEDWHHEPKASMFTRAHHVPAPAAADLEDEPMAMVVIDPKSPADDAGRLPNWEADADGNLFNWNGARHLKPLSHFDPRFAGDDHPKIVAIALEEDGDGVVLFAADQFQEPDGDWVRSTYRITVGM